MFFVSEILQIHRLFRFGGSKGQDNRSETRAETERIGHADVDFEPHREDHAEKSGDAEQNIEQDAQYDQGRALLSRRLDNRVIVRSYRPVPDFRVPEYPVP